MIAYINKHDDTDWPIKSFLVHYQFETIHPFSDGNGRVGRLLLSLIILLWGPLTKPWLFMSSFFERNKEEYTDRLFNVSARAEWTEWVGGPIDRSNPKSCWKRTRISSMAIGNTGRVVKRDTITLGRGSFSSSGLHLIPSCVSKKK